MMGAMGFFFWFSFFPFFLPFLESESGVMSVCPLLDLDTIDLFSFFPSPECGQVTAAVLPPFFPTHKPHPLFCGVPVSRPLTFCAVVRKVPLTYFSSAVAGDISPLSEDCRRRRALFFSLFRGQAGAVVSHFPFFPPLAYG